MKVHKRINYYHNRHRSDGILIEKREIRNENETEDLFLSNQEVIKSFNIKNNLNNFSHTSLNFYKKPNMNNKNREELNLTEENMKNISYPNNNTFNLELTNDEDYLTMEYNNTSDKLIKNLSLLYNELSLKENKMINNFKNNNTKNIDEENILLIKENMKLEQEIKILNKDYSQIEIEKLCDINRKLIKENEYLSSMINKIKISKNNENVMNNSMKYKTDFLVQNMLNSMKDLISILDNESNKDLYMNTNMTLDNKSCNYIPTENLDNFSQSSFSQENQFK
jgi:hypothetical protein